jgi:hypothetical protein
MWAMGNRANRVWIYVLTFCLGVFVILALAMVLYSIHEGDGWSRAARGGLFFSFVISSTFIAIQRRRKSS